MVNLCVILVKSLNISGLRKCFSGKIKPHPNETGTLYSPDSSLVSESVKLILAHLTAVKGRNYDFVKLKEETLFGHWGLPYSTRTLVQN